MTAFILHSSRDGAFSSAFFDLDATTCRTNSSSSALDDADASGEDVYEMALEVLEGDEAYRLESSGSISPESDVDRLLENADAERFPGDVTLIRVFSIQRDVEGGCSWSGHGKDDAGLDRGVLAEADFRRFSNMDDAVAGPMDERLLSDIELYIGETESEASLTVARRSMQKAFDSVDLVSVDLHSNSSSTVGLDEEDTSGPKRTGSEGSGRPDRSFADSGLVCGATFSNVKSKDALIRTSLTVSSFTPSGQRTSFFNCRFDRDDRGLRRSPESEDISLDMTSSDSLYSTDDCFCDSSFPDHNTGGRPAFPAAHAPSFNPREPSPEDLFDLALESRSDLGGSGSIGSSSFYDAVQCSSPNSSACIHRDDPSPEEAFDLALETLSDVIIDDDSSSVFVIAPRPSAAAVSKRPDLLRPDLHRPDLRPDLHRPTIVCHRTAYDVENTRIKMADVMESNSDSFCDLCGRRRCYSATGGGKGSCCGGQSSSCEAGINGDQLIMRGTIDGDLPSDWETRCCGRRRPQETPRLPQEETEELCWSSDPCPSSPETSSTLADYSTDDCAGGESEEEEEEEEEEDSSVTDCDGIDPSSSIRTDFFLRLLRRGKTDLEPVGTGGRTREKLRRRMEEESLLDQIQICSIEDLMTDSDLERDSWNLNARGITTAGIELPLNDNSPILSLFRNIQGRMDGRADESISDLEVGPDVTPAVVVGPIQPLSPPISQSMRADVQYARKSKIPKLPAGSRTTVPPVRISW